MKNKEYIKSKNNLLETQLKIDLKLEDIFDIDTHFEEYQRFAWIIEGDQLDDAINYEISKSIREEFEKFIEDKKRIYDEETQKLRQEYEFEKFETTIKDNTNDIINEYRKSLDERSSYYIQNVINDQLHEIINQEIKEKMPDLMIAIDIDSIINEGIAIAVKKQAMKLIDDIDIAKIIYDEVKEIK